MKLLVTGAFACDEKQLEYIHSLGFDITFIQDEREPLAIDVSEFEAVVCNRLFFYHPIEDFKNIKFIQLTSAGLDSVPMDYITTHRIKICNARGIYSVPIAEFVICGILGIYKHTRFFYDNQKIHKWEKHRGLYELFGKKAVIIGTGSIGCEVAKRLKAFDVKITGIDPVSCSSEYLDERFGPEMLDSVLPDVDIVVLTLPLTKENEGFFGSEKFALMKPSSVFVNVARGRLVDEKSLTDALKNNKIYGAVIDVFEEEPLSEQSPLWEYENAIVTPHNSFVGEFNRQRMFDLAVANLKEVVK